jgi:hypothetical protein
MDNRVAAAVGRKPNWQNPGRISPFMMETASPTKRGPEFNLWFHSPSRYGADLGPAAFREKLHEIDENLEVVWNFVAQRWGLWVKNPRFQNQYSQGWQLLFVHNRPDGGFAPLDETLFARVYTIDMKRAGSAAKYFDRIMSEVERDKEKSKARHTNDNVDIAMESFDHAKIQVSGFGKSNGSKFSTYHSW